MFKISVYKEFDENIKKIWKKIEKNESVTFFQTYDWIYSWYLNVAKKNNKIEIAIILIQINEEVTDILPLCIENIYTFKILKFMGGYNTDYMSPISSTNSFFKIKNNNLKQIKNLFKKNLPKFDIIHFQNLIEEHQKNKNFFISNFNCKKQEISYKVNFKLLSEDIYFKQVSKKFLNDIKRQIRRLKQFGKLELVFPDSKKNFDLFVKSLIDLKDIQYKKTKNSLFSYPGYKKMYIDYSSNPYTKKIIHLCSLKIDNKIISSHYGFIKDKVLYFVMPAYDEKWYKYSPGNVMIYYLIKHCYKNSIRTLDFTDGENFYKRKWANEVKNIYEIHIIFTIKGFIFSIFLKIKLFLLKYKLLRILIKTFRN